MDKKMIQVLISNTSSYKWSKSSWGGEFRGYFILDESADKLYQGDRALDYLSNIHSFDEFTSFLKKVSGSFSIIINNGEEVYAAVDIARSLPLFYSLKHNIVSDSAESIREAAGINKSDVDKDNFLQLYACDYLFGHETAYKDIKQLDLGEAICIKDGEVKTESYFKHIPDFSFKDATKEECKAMLTNAAYSTFEKIKLAIGDRPVLLSMSGGYDSRFVGCMLKNVGVKDVSCYTYGKRGIFEVEQSKKNAEALGFRWTCVELTDELMSSCADNVAEDYWKSYTGHDFTAYMQNFPAVRKLKEMNWIKPNTVVITGLCGDMPTGEYVFREEDRDYTNVFVTNTLWELIFTRYEMPNDFKEKWIGNINKMIDENCKVYDYNGAVRAFQFLYTGTCHVHWFMHMNSVHSFFGYEWLLPYWDKELLTAWYSIPPKYLIGQNLYEEWLLDEICKPYGINQKKFIAGYSKSYTIRKLMYKVGSVIAYLCLNLGVPFKRGSKDYLNQAPLELAIFKKIKCKKTIEYERAGLMHLLNQYLLQERYGVDNVIDAKNILKTSTNYHS